ncbi:MAG: hypothetical protein LBB76_10490 [Azoarcus sp.]|nr:hypothetical protein [Azoarcus sp.]
MTFQAKRAFTWLPGSLMVVFMVAILVFLVVNSRGVAPQARTELLAGLLSLREINARLDVDILRSRNGLNNDYDPLHDGFSAMQQRNEELEQRVAKAKILVSAELERLREAMERKFADIEDFKAVNAIRLNSLRYLPTLVDNLDQHPQVDAVLRLQANKATSGIFRYNLLDDAAVSATRQELETLTLHLGDDDAQDTELAQLLQGFRIHAETILRQNEQETGLLAGLAAIPVVQRIDTLQEALESAFAAKEKTAAAYRNFLAFYSGFLLLLLLYIGARLVRTYRQLARVNRALNDANETLEHRVEERTRDLNNAISELKASEAHLIQSEKMASLGQMVAGVAHEINTPLGYVHGTVEFLLNVFGNTIEPCYIRTRALVEAMGRRPGGQEEDIRQDYAAAAAALAATDETLLPEIRTALKNGLYGLDQISEIVLNLKNFSRLDRGQHTLWQLEDSIDSALMLAKNQVKYRKVVKHYGRNVRKVPCAPSQINQVMLNIITNAAQATSAEDGTITISTRMKGEDAVIVKISDNGMGIPDEVVSRIFDPFFTTKEIGKGTGLGLSIAYKIIEQHRGKIQVFSRPGVGTVFSIELPVTPQEGESAGREEEMLLLEDD